MEPFFRRAFVLLPLLCLTIAASAQTETTLYTFTGGKDGNGPFSLISDGHGNLFGTAVGVNGSVFELSPASGGGWNFTTIYTFIPGAYVNYPRGLSIDAAGNLYGVEENGGTAGHGAVFELSPNGDGTWTFSTLFSFNGNDGRGPEGSLAIDDAGNLYGTTNSGGQCTAWKDGCGLAFELSRNSSGTWTETTLHRFGATATDGQFPVGGLAIDSQGNLYGTTSVGGLTGCSTTTCGTVFELTQKAGKWTEHILHYFGSSPLDYDGGFPLDTPTLGADGNIYGTTSGGGARDQGVVFQLKRTAKGGWDLSVVHSFRSFPTGVNPVAGVTLDGAGNIYAATEDGGSSSATGPCMQINSVQGCGSVWKFTPQATGGWSSKLLYVFTGSADGRRIDANLVVDSEGNVFGAAAAGGLSVNGGYGTIFEITP